jgi:hypothetical protein
MLYLLFGGRKMKNVLMLGLFCSCGLLFAQEQMVQPSLIEQILSIQTIVAVCTAIGVVFTIYQNHRIKTNDLQHLEKYTVAIGKAVHALLITAGRQEDAQKLYNEMSDAYITKA